MAKPTLYLFVGYPGAGKTTVSQLIEEETGAIHLWVDRERQKMFDVPTHSLPESAELYGYLNELTGQLLCDGKSVIFDTNFNYRKDRDYLRTIATKNNANTLVVWITTPKELAKKRATDPAHRERNGYEATMSPEDFDRLSNHLQEPTKDENFIKIDATDLDIINAKRQLKL